MIPIPQGAVEVTEAGALSAALRQLSLANELAADLEADSMHAFRPRLCFVQLADDRDVFLLDTLLPEVRASALAPLFADPARTKFFHAAGGDLQFLAEAGVRVAGLFDTHRAATLLGWEKVGLADLVQQRLGVTLAKEHQQADFSLRPLPPELRQYIADDVRYLVEVGRQVREECRKAEILEEVLLDCQRLADEAVSRPEVGADYRPKLPRGAMKPQEFALAMAIVRELHGWRLKWAQAADVPMGKMLSNAALAAIAARPPQSLSELKRAPGVRGALVREHGEEVLALIRTLVQKSRAGELPEEPEPARDPGRRKREEALKAFRAAMAAKRRVTPSVVLPNPLVEELAKAPPRSPEELAGFPYLGEKRIQLYGEELLRLFR